MFGQKKHLLGYVRDNAEKIHFLHQSKKKNVIGSVAVL